MRTLSAVRTRLRGPVPDADDERARDADDDNDGNGDAPRSAVGDTQVAEEELPASPMDPLLADPPVPNGHRDRAVEDVAPAVDEAPLYEATIVEAPPEVVDPRTEPVMLPAAHPEPTGAEPAPRPAARPRSPRQRVRPTLPLLRRRPRVRKVTRIVRRVDAWGVFKISLIFYVILYIILLVAGVLLWNLANTTGTVANVEGFARDLFGLKTFEFDGEKLFRASWVLGAILVVAGTGLNVSDLVGGVRVTVLDEEVILRQRPVVPPRAEAQLPLPEDGRPFDPASELAPPGFPLPPPEVVDADAPPPGSFESPRNAGL
jgi:hypothetical protein